MTLMSSMLRPSWSSAYARKNCDDVKADWAGVQLFDAERNAEFFDEETEVNAYTTLQFAIDFYTRTEIITNELDVNDMLDPSYVIVEEEAE